MENEKTELGKRGEDAACAYLISLGHRIAERNWRNSHLELDIISVDAEGLHIVEVKSRKAPALIEPQYNVTSRKREKVVRAALCYLHSEDKKLHAPDAEEVFFDVISVLFDECDTKITYFPKAFIPMYYGR